jgi:hypothetical protein
MPEQPEKANKEPVERAWNYSRAVDMAMAGATNAQIAKDLDVDASLIRKYFASGEGQARLREALAESMDRTSRFAQTAHAIALRTLVKAMNDSDKWSDKISAARAITALQARRVELTGLDGGAIQLESTSVEVEALRERLLAIRERHEQVDGLELVPVIEDAEVVEESADA